MNLEQLHQHNYQLLQNHAQTCAEIKALSQRLDSLKQRADLILEDIGNIVATINKKAEEEQE